MINILNYKLEISHIDTQFISYYISSDRRETEEIQQEKTWRFRLPKKCIAIAIHYNHSLLQTHNYRCKRRKIN